MNRGPALLVAVWMIAASAGRDPAGAQRYLVHTYSENEGLPSSTIRDVVQDPSGRLWVATRSGLAVYDGVEWAVATPAGSGLPVDQAGVAIDETGRLWAVSTGPPFRISGLGDDGWQVRIEPPPEAERWGPANGLAATVADGRTRLAVATKQGGLFVWNGERWRLFAVLAPSWVTPVAAWQGRFFVPTPGGLAVVDGDGVTAVPLGGESPAAVVGVAVEPRAGGEPRIWLVGRDWAGYRDGEAFTRLPDPVAVPGVDGVLVEPDRRGGVFFGNPLGIFHLEPGRGVAPLDPRAGLIANGATALFLDREEDLWVGSLRGLSKIASFRFATWDQDHGLLENEVTAVLELRRGGIVLGHSSGLTWGGEDGWRTQSLLAPDQAAGPRARVLDLEEDALGGLWVAASGLGLARVAGGRIDWSLRDAGQGVVSVRLDERGVLWAATMSCLYQAEGPVETPIWVEERCDSRDRYRRLLRRRGGGVAVLTLTGGVYEADDRAWRRLWAGTGKAGSEDVYAYLETADGARWFGTAIGLFRQDGATVDKVELADLGNRPVYALAADDRGRLWIGTDNGVVRWDRDAGAIRHFTVLDGLAGREINRAALVEDRRHGMWIGTDRGVSRYREAYERRDPRPPVVELLRVDAGGESYPLDREASLASHQNELTFRYRAVSFVDERRLRVRTWLEGFELHWTDPSAAPTRELRYTNLPPGTYRFHLRAATAEGVWSDEAVSAPIRIAPPVWRRGWFFALVAAALGAVFAAVHSYVAQRRYAHKLEREVRSRTAELIQAQKLESLGLLAGGIAHDFNNLLTVVLGHLTLLELHSGKGPGASKSFGDARGAVLRARDLTQQLLTFSRGGAPIRAAASVVDVIRDSVAFVLSGSAVRAEIELPEDLWMIDVDAGQINQVLNNLLINAVQAMPDGGVVRLRGRNLASEERGGPFVEIEIEDEGVGIPEEHLAKVFDPYFTTKERGSGLGLATAYAIVHSHDGQIAVDSAPGRGTTFRIRLPARPGVRPEEVEPSGELPKGSGRILVMDDEPSVREVAERILQLVGYTPVLASDGIEALERFAEAEAAGEPFAAVVLDLTIPGGQGGVETLARMREIDPDVRAVAASGYSNDPVMARFRDYGFAAIMPKPFGVGDLARVLDRLLGPQ